MSDEICQNIFIIGAQSTGKTTLVEALKKHFAEENKERNERDNCPAVISEVARDVIERTKITREVAADSPEQCLTLQKAILLAQSKAEARALSRSAWYISDRSGLDPVVYTKLLVSEAAVHDLLETPHWQKLEDNMKAGLVLLCEAGCGWLVDDGVHLMPKDGEGWKKVDMTFRGMLSERGIAYTLISKDLTVAERIELVLSMREKRAGNLHL